jgi:hypothetical protein
MAVRLIEPSWIAFFKTGATLRSPGISNRTPCDEDLLNSLRWVCRVNDDGVLGLVIYNKVGVVVGTTNPYACLLSVIPPHEELAMGQEEP